MSKKIKKKDFDKEKMYAKIMPSIVVPERAAQLPEKAPPEEAAPPTEAVSPPQASQAPQAAVEEPAPSGMHNYMENMVRDKLPHTMKVLGACDCPRCREDIMSLALNQLPCFYAVAGDSDGTRYLQKLRGAYEVKVTASLIKAIQQVKTNPRH